MLNKKTIHIDLAERSYPIHIGNGLLNHSELLRELVPGRQVFVISDDNVKPLYSGHLHQALDGLQVESFTITAGEASKNADNWLAALDRLMAMGASRDVCIIGLGGGVVGDLAGFVAASYMRGVALIQIPTSLLAQVDSSVGGKTAINHPRGKNLIGAFHQPKGVIIDTATLETLPEREYAAGLAEVIKYGLIRDATFFSWLEDNISELVDRADDAMIYAIESSCRHKADVVAMDEREGGVRALLNLGHTFGHAIETATGYQEYLHGEAVAIGLFAAADLSARAGFCEAAAPERIEGLLKKSGLPSRLKASVDPAKLRSLMKLDKKNLSGQLRLILMKGIGQSYIEDQTAELPIDETLAGLFPIH